MIKTTRFASVIASAMIIFAGIAVAQTDPGVQSASRGTGATIIPSGDTTGFLTFFNAGLVRFQQVESVSTPPNNGLGPRFNSNSCVSCHAQPAAGGSGAAVNPQFEFATNGVAPGNATPSFITASGPTREARFVYMMNSNGTVDTGVVNGGVEDLFTVSGRSDRGACTSLAQPNFAAAETAGNVVFRIPTPTFGTGLVENLDDSTLLNNRTANLVNSFGISGSFNRNTNDGTITKFGWKAQNKSLQVFAGEAYNVEVGVTNELYNNERPLPEEDQLGKGLPASCLNLTGTGYPEDTSNPTQTPNSAVLDDVSAFANLMRFLAPPPPGGVILNGEPVPAATIAAGKAIFVSIGCATCHNPSPGTTQSSNFVPALSKQPVPAFSDFELHHMGTGFADNISQGNAGGDEFRTAPLWGLGQRIFFDHDGRDLTISASIQNHSSNGSEANTVITNYDNLNQTQKQALIDFLRSL
ncbi:MAG: di-heme oxidoredictase family protein [Terracidiphilus sp.]